MVSVISSRPVAVAVFLAAAAASRVHPAEFERPLFQRDVQPLLQKHCVVCHGPDEAESGLRLDLADRAYARLESGTRAVVPGNPDASELMVRVTATDDAERMPPEGDPLTDEEVSILRRWIENGARYEEHWAWQPVRPISLPAVQNTDWVSQPIDRFVLARLEAAGLSPSPRARPETLVRRLAYDLTGLPPQPADTAAFLNSPDEAHWEQLVDRMLASPHFGERWGRHWLDVARYADSDGYEKDRPRPNAWRYRDWVIQAINDDMPFDRFTVEQLAGDLLPQATPLQKLATAFHRQTLTNTEGGVDQEQFRVEAVFDRTETTAAVWMALTLTCARCHSHKYDRISQTEYYRLFSFFNAADEATTDVIRSEADQRDYERRRKEYDRKLAALTTQYNTVLASVADQVRKQLEELQARIRQPSRPLTVRSPAIVQAAADNGVRLQISDAGDIRAAGARPDKTTCTITLQSDGKPFFGFRLSALAGEDLPSGGPGRADNGNFVLTGVEAFVSDTDDFAQAVSVPLVLAESTYSQKNFDAADVLSEGSRTGWAVGGRTGQDHRLTVYAAGNFDSRSARFCRIVLRQEYGGRHTIGRFRIELLNEPHPLKSLPEPVRAAVVRPAQDRTPADQRALTDYAASFLPQTARLQQQLEELKRQAPKPPFMSVRIMTTADRETRVLHRGDFLQPDEQVHPGVPEILGRHHPLTSRNPDRPPDRLDFARWLVHPDHPLTARVTVNRIWAHLFGRGIVPTLNDFGVRGELPSHPELLDWLAGQFSGELKWSRRRLIRMIVLSSTWRQASDHRPELFDTDPGNRLLARQNRFRVEAEIVRDLYLAAGGLLRRQVGGPSVFPPLPPGVAELSYAGNFKWKTSPGDQAWRRGMYTFFKRTAPHPTLISFDCPDSNTTRLQREISNTPLQALITLNNEVFVQAARGLARLARGAGVGSDEDRVRWTLQRCLVRVPESQEIARFVDLLQTARLWYQQHPDQAKKLVGSDGDEEQIVDQAAWIIVARMILNLDEFIVRD